MSASGIITSATDVLASISAASREYTVQWTDTGTVPSSFRWLEFLAPSTVAQSVRATSASALSVGVARRITSGASTINTTSVQTLINDTSQFLQWPPDPAVDNWRVLDPLGINLAWSRTALFSYNFGAHFANGPGAAATLNPFFPEGWHLRWQTWQVPTITSLTPSVGLTAGGASVQIDGTEYYQSSSTITPHVRQVLFDGVAATITSSSPTRITVDTPAHAAGVVDVSVIITYDDGASETVTSPFTYRGPETITGSGGIQASGSPQILAYGSGAPPELHLNQWGLLQFVMEYTLEETL